jgi:hypothetical protein
MEYRGYDSAGLEIDGDEADKPMIFKEVGKVAMLREKCLKADVDMNKSYLSQTSIAHTRYAIPLRSPSFRSSPFSFPPFAVGLLTVFPPSSTATLTRVTPPRSSPSSTTVSSPTVRFPPSFSRRPPAHLFPPLCRQGAASRPREARLRLRDRHRH